MANIFISYRREDSSASAGRVFDRLRDHFAHDHVFRDIDTLAPGEEFERVIRERIAASDALVAVIGKEWLTVKNADGHRRLDDPRDLVRAEIHEALTRGKLVIPTLVDGARMPSADEIPDSISALAGRNAIEISHSRFDYDVNRLVEAIEEGSSTASPHGPGPSSAIKKIWQRLGSVDLQRRLKLVGTAVAALVIGVWSVYVHFSREDTDRSPSLPPGPNAVPATGTTASHGPGGTTVIAPGGSITIHQQGVPYDRYLQDLERRGEQIRTELRESGRADGQKVAELEKQLNDVRAKLADSERSVAEHRIKIAETNRFLEQLPRGVPSSDVSAAQKSLSTGETGPAEEILRQVIRTGENQAAAAAFQLARLAYDKVDYGKAFEHYAKAAQLTPDSAEYQNMAGRVALDLGRYQQAQPYLEKALEIRRKTLPSPDNDTATSLNNLAYLYRNRGMYAKAEELYREALAIQKDVLGPVNPDVAITLNNFARLRRAQGLNADAESLYLEALSILQKSPGAEPADVAMVLNNLAALYRSEKLYSKAESMYAEAIGLRKQALGIDHPDVAGSLNNLGELLVAQGMRERAEPLYQEALAIQKRSLGPDHPVMAVTLNNLAELYRSMGRFAEAEPHYRQALMILERAEPDHPDNAKILNNLALNYFGKKEYEKALPLFEKALGILEKAIPPDYPILQRVMLNYSQCLALVGRNAEAQRLRARAETIRRQAPTS